MDELTWFPRKIGMLIESNSSSNTLPQDGLVRLKVSNKYSGSYLRGWSKTYLTFVNMPEFSESTMSLSTRSMDYQTSMTSDDSPLSLISAKSFMLPILFFNLLNKMVLSFLDM